jgi:hypothetical protein
MRPIRTLILHSHCPRCDHVTPHSICIDNSLRTAPNQLLSNFVTAQSFPRQQRFDIEVSYLSKPLIFTRQKRSFLSSHGYEVLYRNMRSSVLHYRSCFSASAREESSVELFIKSFSFILSQLLGQLLLRHHVSRNTFMAITINANAHRYGISVS